MGRGDRMAKGEVVAPLDGREITESKGEHPVARVSAAPRRPVFERDKVLCAKRIMSERQYLRSQASYPTSRSGRTPPGASSSSRARARPRSTPVEPAGGTVRASGDPLTHRGQDRRAPRRPWGRGRAGQPGDRTLLGRRPVEGPCRPRGARRRHAPGRRASGGHGPRRGGEAASGRNVFNVAARFWDVVPKPAGRGWCELSPAMPVRRGPEQESSLARPARGRQRQGAREGQDLLAVRPVAQALPRLQHRGRLGVLCQRRRAIAEGRLGDAERCGHARQEHGRGGPGRPRGLPGPTIDAAAGTAPPRTSVPRTHRYPHGTSEGRPPETSPDRTEVRPAGREGGRAAIFAVPGAAGRPHRAPGVRDPFGRRSGAGPARTP